MTFEPFGVRCLCFSLFGVRWNEIICGAVVSCLVFLRLKFSMLTSPVPGSFSSRLLSHSWTFIQKSFPGKYKSETHLQVSTVSTRRHALTLIRFDVLILWIIVTTGFSCVTTRFSALNCNWRKRTWKRPNWLDNCTWLGISLERLACCGKGTCHGFQSTVGSATTEIRTLRELGLHTFILRTSLYLLAVQLLMLNRKTPWCKS